MITVLTNMISQEPLTGKSFATVLTYQRLCSNEVYKCTEVSILQLILIWQRKDENNYALLTYGLGLPV